MRKLLCFLSAAIVGTANGICGVPAVAGDVTQTRIVRDPEWNMQAATVTIPRGWKFDGMVTHGETCINTLPGLRSAAQSPDGNEEVQLYPQINYSYSSDMQLNRQKQGAGCLISQHVSAADFLTNVIAPGIHRGVPIKLFPVADGPAVVQDRAFLQHLWQRVSFPVETDIRNYAVGFELPHGQRELFIAQFQCVKMHYPQMQQDNCEVDNAISFRAPKDKLPALIKSVAVHTAIAQAWNSRVHDLLMQRRATGLQSLAQQGAAGMAAIDRNSRALTNLHNTLMNNSREQYDAGVERNREMTEGMHQSMVGTANSMGDKNTFQDSTTGKTYEGSNAYSHTYVNSTGQTYVQTNSAYAPGPDTVWQELQPK